MMVHSRKGLGGEGEGGNGLCVHSGTPLPQRETSESSAFRKGQFSGHRAEPRPQHGTTIVTSTQEGYGGYHHIFKHKYQELQVQPPEHNKYSVSAH